MTHFCLTVIVLLSLVGFVVASTVSPIDWEIGAGTSLYSAAGNISLTAPGIDGELSLHRTNARNSSWQLTLSHFWPRLSESNPLPTAKTTIVYLLRGAPIRLNGYETWLKAGLGLGYFVRKRGNESLEFGTLCYRADLNLPIYSAIGLDLEGNLSYIGSVLPGTQYFTDRLGFGLVIVSRLFQNR